MLYLDTSAFLKLLVVEEDSVDLSEALDGRDLWSSSLLEIEAHRAARRLGVDRADVVARLDTVTLVLPSSSTFANARDMGPDLLRTLDAVHLATALELVPDLDAVLTYDRRLAAGSAESGLAVQAPGRPPSWWA